MTAGTRLSLAWTNMKALVQDHALLAVLEVQRAGISLVKMIAAGIMISILAVTTWIALVAACVVWAIGEGADWALAIFIAAIVNLLVAAGIGLWAKKQIPDLMFAATVRQLKKDVPPEEEDEHGAEG
jgi:uncharacterized membrane protein YqjE